MKEKESVTVKIGDHVKKGQVITKSGDVGFCPTSHLHIQFHLSDDPRAPTVLFAFAQLLDQENQNNDNEPFIPQTGQYYNLYGLVSKR